MTPKRPGRGVLAAVMLALVAAESAVAAGNYEDLGRISYVVRAPRAAMVEGQVARIRAPSHDASLFYLNAHLPVRDGLLVRAELSFVSLRNSEDIEDGFGDFRLRARLPVARGNERVLMLIASFRSGSGTSKLYPYSTGSVDFEGGMAFVDTLGAVSLWGSATGTVSTRVGDELSDRHGEFVTLSGGLALAGSPRYSVGIGAGAFLRRSGGNSGHYYAEFDVRPRAMTTLFAAIQVEGGPASRRELDVAATFGIRYSY